MAFNITSLSNIWSAFKDEVRDYLNRSLDKTGDTMTGALTMENTLTLAEDPDVIDVFSQNREAASKGYVDMMNGFRPGDTYLSAWTPGSGTIFYPINMGEEQVITLSNENLTPSASGMLLYRYSISSGANQFSNGVNYSNNKPGGCSVTYRLNMVYHLDGYDDVILYDDLVVLDSNNNFSLNSDKMDVLLPMKKGVIGSIRAHFILEGCTTLNNSYNQVSMNFNINGTLYYDKTQLSVLVTN